MFSNLTIGLLMGVGFGAWVYSKIYRSSGGNNKNALIVAGFAGLGALIVVTTILSVVL